MNQRLGTAEWIGAIATVVGLIVAGAMAYGALNTKVEAQLPINERLQQQIDSHRSLFDKDHDLLIEINERTREMKLTLDHHVQQYNRYLEGHDTNSMLRSLTNKDTICKVQ